MEIKLYLLANGKCPYLIWLNELDMSVRMRIQARMARLKDDEHFGESKMISRGLYELKFRTLGGGVRIYFGKDGDSVVVLLLGGSKSRQEEDILKAKIYWNDYTNSV